jgi:translation initiation factor IF-1
VRLRLRDRVEVELTSADPKRGRIVKVFDND